jgi:tetratricopeptide (TPR) repeat protein
LNEAMNLTPNFSAAYNNRGLVHARRNDFDLAFADYSEAIRRDPNNALAYNNRGLIHARRYDYAGAVADYSEAIRHNHPNLAQVYSNRGLAHKALGLSEEAIADFHKAQAINPSDGTSKAQLALISPATTISAETPNAGSTAREAATERGNDEAVATAMSRLSINLPASVAGIDAVRIPLDDLGREPCDRLAIVKLGLALGNVGRKREAATAQLGFSAACGGHVPSLKGILLDLSDYAGATAAANRQGRLKEGREAAVVIGTLKPSSDGVGVMLVTGAVLKCKAAALHSLG